MVLLIIPTPKAPSTQTPKSNPEPSTAFGKARKHCHHGAALAALWRPLLAAGDLRPRVHDIKISEALLSLQIAEAALPGPQRTYLSKDLYEKIVLRNPKKEGIKQFYT